MAQCEFSIPFDVAAIEVADKARRAIAGAGGTFQGNEEAGKFDVSTPLGSIRGTYMIQHPYIYVTITSKPFLISCGMIEKQLKGYFAALV